MHKASGLAELGRGAMSDKSSALRAKSDDVQRRQTSQPIGSRRRRRAGFVARRSQSYGYAPSSRRAGAFRRSRLYAPNS